MKIRINIEYKGSKYYGWQKQSSGNTIQNELEMALKKITSEKINVTLYISKTLQSLKKIEVITMVILHAIRQSVHSAFTVYLLIYLKVIIYKIYRRVSV